MRALCFPISGRRRCPRRTRRQAARGRGGRLRMRTTGRRRASPCRRPDPPVSSHAASAETRWPPPAAPAKWEVVFIGLGWGEGRGIPFRPPTVALGLWGSWRWCHRHATQSPPLAVPSPAPNALETPTWRGGKHKRGWLKKIQFFLIFSLSTETLKRRVCKIMKAVAGKHDSAVALCACAVCAFDVTYCASFFGHWNMYVY